MPDIDRKVKAILKSAELSFELGIINPTRFGPMIHANIPDYAEILLRVFIEQKTGITTRDDFPGLVRTAKSHFHSPLDLQFESVTVYFLDTRNSFRNPLHHTDRVQGYVIEELEALKCFLKFDELLGVLFPSLAVDTLSDLNYPCYLKFLRMEYDERLGRGNHRLYQAIIAALQQMEVEDNFRCPTQHDAARLMAVRRLFRFDDEKFTWTVLKHRPVLKGKIINLLESSGKRLTPRQIRNALAVDPSLRDLRQNEVESCLRFLEGEPVDSKGFVRVIRAEYYLAAP